jgi:hypothetical protein
MTKIIWIAALAYMVPTLAFADDGPAAYLPYPDWILFGLALILTAWLSAQAFDPANKSSRYPNLSKVHDSVDTIQIWQSSIRFSFYGDLCANGALPRRFT